MRDFFQDSHTINIDPMDSNKKYEDVFFLESNPTSDFNISINEDSFMPYRLSDEFSKTKPTTMAHNNNLDSHSRSNSNSNSNSNNSAIELKRKKNREASKVSRQKKKKDIICLVKINEILKEQIKALTIQIDNNICSQCKEKLSNQPSIKPISKEHKIEGQMKKPSSFSSLSPSSSLNSSSARAKTAMFISVVVLFCVVVNSFSDRSKNYLRKVTLNNYSLDYFNLIQMNSNNSNGISQCLDLLKYHYSIDRPGINNKNDDNNNNNIRNQQQLIKIVHNSSNQGFKCQKMIINVGENEDNNVNSNDNNSSSINENKSFSLNVIANREYLISKFFDDDNMFQEEPNKPAYLQLECVDIYLNIKK